MLCSPATYALQPPTKAQLEKYRKDNTLQHRLALAKEFGNHKIAPHLVKSAHERMRKLQRNVAPSKTSNKDLKWFRGLPSIGDVKMFTLLIDFSDAPAPAHQGVAVMENHIYGKGDISRYPLESLTQFYLRSSYNKLHITGNALGWYRVSKPRSAYTESIDAKEIIHEALIHFEKQGHDFSQYDNDGDGAIDYFAVIWAGPTGDFSGLWWGWKAEIPRDESFTVSNKKLASFSWQWLSDNNETDDFEPGVLIHETGHGLGLPDFYDQDDRFGPRGGVGGLDQMDMGGDHGAFSKFMLGWIEPKVIGSGSHQVSLKPSSSTEDALIIMPGLSLDQKFSEYYVIQNRDQRLNDKNNPGAGLLMWHVDANTNNDGFVYDNSYTEHKLIKLIQADGLDELEKGLDVADEGDYYSAGQALNTMSHPRTTSYKNGDTGIEISNINVVKDAMSFTANIATVPQFIHSGIENLTMLDASNTLTVTPDTVADIAKVTLTINGNQVAEDTQAPYIFDIKKEGIAKGLVNISISVITKNNVRNVKDVTALNTSEQDVLVLNIGDRNDVEEIVQALTDNNKTVYVVDDVPDITDADIGLLFVLNSYYESINTPLSDEQISRLVSYISSGGDIYYENALWVFAQEAPLVPLTQALGVMLSGVASHETSAVVGEAGTELYGIRYTAVDPWPVLVELAPNVGETETLPIWKTDDKQMVVGIKNKRGNGNLIITTEQFTDISQAKQQLVMTNYLSLLASDDIVATTAKVKFTSTSFSVNEGESKVSLALSRSFDDGSNSPVEIKFSDGNAKYGVHFGDVIAPVSFATGELDTTVDIAITHEDMIETGNLTFKAMLSGENAGAVNSTDISIIENDNAGRIKFSATNINVKETETSFTITVLRQGDFSLVNAFTIGAYDDYAQPDIDYKFEPVNSQFEATTAGQQSLDFDVTILHNKLSTKDLSFSFYLEGKYLADDYNSLHVVITNQDKDQAKAGEISFGKNNISAAENAGSIAIKLVRSGGSAGELTVTVATVNGSAKASTDYQALSKQVTFAAGVTEQSVNLTIIDNETVDATRNFMLELTGAGVSADKQTMQVAITNEDKETATTAPSTKQSEDKGESSGGSLSWGWLLVLAMFLRYRTHSKV